jgi:dCMP deaminase
MQVAHLIKERGTCIRAQQGAVIVDKSGRIIATGYNGAPPGHPHCHESGCIEVEMDDNRTHCLRAVHADMNAVWSGIIAAQPIRMIGATMYVTAHPCPRCLPILLASGIKRVVYERYGYTNFDPESPEMDDVSEAFSVALEPFGVEHPTQEEPGRGSKPRKPRKHRK